MSNDILLYLLYSRPMLKLSDLEVYSQIDAMWAGLVSTLVGQVTQYQFSSARPDGISLFLVSMSRPLTQHRTLCKNPEASV